MAAKQTQKAIVPRWLITVGVLVIVGFALYGVARVWFPQWFVAGAMGSNQAQSQTVGSVRLTDMVETVETTGRLDALQVSDVYWQTTGRVGKVLVEVGDNVKKGAILLQVDENSVSPQLVNAQADLILAQQALKRLTAPSDLQIAQAQSAWEQAKEQLRLAEKTSDNLPSSASTERKDQTAAQLALAQAQAADTEAKYRALADSKPNADDLAAAEARVRAAEMSLQNLNLVAPFEGTVLDINYLPGDSILQNIAGVRLADLSQYVLELQIDEADIAGIKVDQLADITFDALPKQTYQAKVTLVQNFGETVQGITRYRVRLVLQNPSPELRLGMTANTSIVTNTQKNVLAVPLDAVQLDDQGEYVMLYNSSSQAKTRVPVVSGQIQDDLVVITGDLKAGDQVLLFEPKPASGSPFGG